MAATLQALLGFIAWTLLLLVLMEAIRSWLVLSGAEPANGFNPENSNLSPFMQRLVRAHANCLEGLPVFGGLMLVAVVADRSAITDPLAWLLLGARVVQSLIHRRHGAVHRLRCADGDRRVLGVRALPFVNGPEAGALRGLRSQAAGRSSWRQR